MAGGGNRMSSAAQVKARERERRSIELRLAGETYAVIAQELGVTEMGAQRSYMRAIARIPKKEADAARTESLERLNQARLVVNEELARVRNASVTDENGTVVLETALSRSYAVRALVDQL